MVQRRCPVVEIMGGAVDRLEAKLARPVVTLVDRTAIPRGYPLLVPPFVARLPAAPARAVGGRGCTPNEVVATSRAMALHPHKAPAGTFRRLRKRALCPLAPRLRCVARVPDVLAALFARPKPAEGLELNSAPHAMNARRPSRPRLLRRRGHPRFPEPGHIFPHGLRASRTALGATASAAISSGGATGRLGALPASRAFRPRVTGGPPGRGATY